MTLSKALSSSSIYYYYYHNLHQNSFHFVYLPQMTRHADIQIGNKVNHVFVIIRMHLQACCWISVRYQLETHIITTHNKVNEWNYVKMNIVIDRENIVFKFET